ncbi:MULTISPECIES: long-chain fatty acid--CoA ligase [unclassified Mesobacillus]|uniref:class I adenylate-forming enzyme family protein n=1 Tax=unclassified Mesobacillus TaxID=2675270 RepID=UPI002041CA78|nr:MULTISPECIES: long-chain fatty acid--CoA ligase [unclassified Mesobacillus]MCM3124568.1 long-chain fatty acid--CoA ligase [Mesobacillus sp. MER 33]MCM3234722.1 long-chain fatty acid--CoA ligase [Mesobacillus sp. MER 48]
MDIGSYLAQNARKTPEKLAIVCEGRSFTYQQFNEEVNKLAHGLLSLGIHKGDRIALMMKNSAQFVFAFFAGAKIGAVIVPVNFRLTASEVHYILEQSGTVLVICDDEFEEIITSAGEGTNAAHVITTGTPKAVGHHSFENVLSKTITDPQIDVSDDDDLEILYTSGTTGRPKGALFDHKRVFNVGLTMMISMAINQEERILHIAPLFHSAQLNLFLISGVILGATHIIHREFHPVTTLQAIQQHKITHFFGVPAMYNFMLQVPNAGDYDLSSIKRCGYGAAPMAPELVRKSMELFRTDQFYNLCGLTEAGPGGILLGPEGHKHHLGKGGKAAFLTEARVVDEEEKDIKPGAVGEFIIKGESIMKEYYKKPEETAKTIKDGWLYTGDLATVDENGYITLVDRKKDMIISGGENVYSIEVEEVLYEHPAVLEAAIIGMPDEVWGEAVCAVIVPKKDAVVDEQELKSFCRQKLAGYKVPRKIFIEEALPRNASGKILKYQLRQKLNEVKL